jgi:hypothetical protein
VLPLTIRPALEAGFQEHELSLVHTWRDLTGAVCAYGYRGDHHRWIRWPGFAAFRFDDDGQIDAFPERQVDPAKICDLARRAVEPIILQAIGWETVHASSVATTAGVVAFCGERESGKSTLAYSLARRGYRQRSDDSVVIRIEAERVAVLELPFGVRLRHDPARHFGFTPDDGPYADVAPIDHTIGQAPQLETLAAVFVLSGRDTTTPIATRLAGSAAFTAVLAHSHVFDPESIVERQRLLEHYLAIAARVPVYDLRFPSGLSHLPAVLDCVEQTIGIPLETASS